MTLKVADNKYGRLF